MSDFWQETINAAHELRHELHTHPELGWQEKRTAERIRAQLSELNIPWRACAQTGTVATLNPQGSDAPHIALRGDIDALPIHEKTDSQWQSQTEGCMHACGHDGHTATLMAAARWLKKHEPQLPGPVTLLFQPAEEGGHGARGMIEGGALEGVSAIYGWHNWPAIGFGRMVCPDGLVMCGNGTFSIRLKGRGGHASQPDLCADPVLAASAITVNLQQILSRRLPPQATAVVSVTSINAPSGATIIPETAELGGSIRVPDDTMREKINGWITEICESTAASYGVACEVEHQRRYHATINHAEPARNVRNAWAGLYGDEALESPAPIMASEDFSYYLREIPGAFALIGADDGPGHQHPCHSPYYDFNDRLISRVVALFAQLAGAPLPQNLTSQPDPISQKTEAP